MIALVEGASRQKTPNEIALNILLAGLTIIFLLAVVTLPPFAIYSGTQQRVIVLVALLVCLIPTTIGALLSAIGIAGMDRLVQHNVLAVSGRAVEAAGDVDTLLLDKTGTITLGNRQASEFLPVNGLTAEEFADAAQLASLADETPEGRSIVVLAKNEYRLRARGEGVMSNAHLVPFTAETRMSGVDITDHTGVRQIRKGAAAAVMKWVRDHGGHPTNDVGPIVDGISSSGGTPLVVAERIDGQPARALGVIHLKDIIKAGMRERFEEMRRMSIRTVMITGDNPKTARAIALSGLADHRGGDRGAGPGQYRAHRQGPGRARDRSPDRRPRPADAAPGPPRRARPPRQSRRSPAVDRVGLRHPQGPTRAGEPRRPNPTRRVHPGRAAPARPGRRDMPQLGHRRPRQAQPDRLRPLTNTSLTESIIQ